jgi:hypothetical protein
VNAAITIVAVSSIIVTNLALNMNLPATATRPDIPGGKKSVIAHEVMYFSSLAL